MITSAQFRLLAVAVLLSTSGCGGDCPHGGESTFFKWPESVPCPRPKEAALYLGAYEEPGACGISLVSIDGVGVHTKDGCTYPVTLEICSDGCHIN